MTEFAPPPTSSMARRGELAGIFAAVETIIFPWEIDITIQFKNSDGT